MMRSRLQPLRRFSRLTLRVLAINLLALALLGLGLLVLDRYENGLAERELATLQLQAQLVAGAIAEGAVDDSDPASLQLDPNLAQILVRRLAASAEVRARLFGLNGHLITDSSLLLRPMGYVQITPIPGDEDVRGPLRYLFRLYDWMFNSLPRRDSFPPYQPAPEPMASVFPEAMIALGGDVGARFYVDVEGHLVFSVAAPVQRYRKVLGVLMLERPSVEMDNAVRAVRFDILRLFLAAFCLTILLSVYLAGAITRPIRKLAAAAGVAQIAKERSPIPDFSRRGDEIGDLSVALRSMTDALFERLEATERFAADVAHELKNPLTSLRSAAETVVRLEDPERRNRLLGLMIEDVRRLDRLITDIAQASRLDAELARTKSERIDLRLMLMALVEVHEETRSNEAQRVTLRINAESEASLEVQGLGDRLGQVFRNLIDNALSFSPVGGVVLIRAHRSDHAVVVTIDDDGPGIPPGKEATIFDRFYSERPETEAFGAHSGLGLSISRQIVLAHRGRIQAMNRQSADGKVIGARLIVELPPA
jgi:two-component system sensor histidine kinase ChvG